jgi:Tfp pilus assembly protein PilO
VSKQGTRTIVAMLAVALLVGGFWILLLGPKREEADKLGVTVSKLKESVAVARQQVSEALAARRGFSGDYQQLVVLGKAVPGDDETASLLVSLEHIAAKAKVSFREIELQAGDSAAPEATEAAPPAAEAPPASSSTPASVPAPAAPTEATAASLPLGATVGSAGLGVMPYKLRFIGDFSHVADFIQGLDSLVKTHNSKIAIDGRLITVDGFSLSSVDVAPFPLLEANFIVTTYLTPPDQGVTAGATPATPSPVTSTPASTTTGGAP